MRKIMELMDEIAHAEQQWAPWKPPTTVQVWAAKVRIALAEHKYDEPRPEDLEFVRLNEHETIAGVIQ